MFELIGTYAQVLPVLGWIAENTPGAGIELLRCDGSDYLRLELHEQAWARVLFEDDAEAAKFKLFHGGE